MKKKVIVIGGGVAGLSAGCYSLMNDYETLIFDQNSHPGGLVTTYSKSSYKFDVSISFLYGHKPNSPFYSLFKELNIANPDIYVDLKEFNYIFPDNHSIKVTSNLGQLESDLIQLSPRNKPEITSFVDDIRLMGKATFDANGNPVFDKKFFTLKYLQSAIDYSKSLQDENLKFIMTNIFFPTLPLYAVLWYLGLFVNNEVGHTKYGCQDFSGRMASYFEKLGGKLYCKTLVEKILVENNKAIGILLGDGTTHYADFVVCACDYHSVYYGLLDNKYPDESVNKRFANWKLFDGITFISYGVKKIFPILPFYNTVYFDPPVNVLGRDVHDAHLKNFKDFTHFAPEGKSSIQLSFWNEFDVWDELRKKDKEAYYQEKKAMAQVFLDRIDKHLPGLKENVEVTDVSTPYTIWRYSLNYKASIEGWIPTSKTVMLNLPIKIPELKSLYLAGQWLKPGGGVSKSLLTGKEAIKAICKDEEKEFVTV